MLLRLFLMFDITAVCEERAKAKENLFSPTPVELAASAMRNEGSLRASWPHCINFSGDPTSGHDAAYSSQNLANKEL